MKLRFWFVRETDKARLYTKIPPDRHPEPTDLIWIPRSIVEHTTKRGIEHVLELPDWFIEQEGL